MATWKELSLENLEAAKALLGQGYWRASINRSYYAAYCAISQALTARGVQFARGWNNPAHEQLLALIRNGLALTQSTRRALLPALRRLRFARETADYRPGAAIDRVQALDGLRDAVTILRALED